MIGRPTGPAGTPGVDRLVGTPQHPFQLFSPVAGERERSKESHRPRDPWSALHLPPPWPLRRVTT